MALKRGEVYKCTNPECGCEVTVTKEAAGEAQGNYLPRCCCGEVMQKR